MLFSGLRISWAMPATSHFITAAQAVLAAEVGFQLLPNLGHAVDGMADFSKFVVALRKAIAEIGFESRQTGLDLDYARAAGQDTRCERARDADQGRQHQRGEQQTAAVAKPGSCCARPGVSWSSWRGCSDWSALASITTMSCWPQQGSLRRARSPGFARSRVARRAFTSSAVGTSVFFSPVSWVMDTNSQGNERRRNIRLPRPDTSAGPLARRRRSDVSLAGGRQREPGGIGGDAILILLVELQDGGRKRPGRTGEDNALQRSGQHR